MSASAGGPLQGVGVVDLSHHLAGPLAAMILAQLGADVLKVEPPEGDGWRQVDDLKGESRLFHAVNRDKRGIVLDLKSEAGRDALLRLVDEADVVVHSFSPGVVERLGIGAAELCGRNPRLVYCSLSAFGTRRRGTDLAVQSESGLVTANGGVPVPVPVHDTLAPYIMVTGILAALLERETSGRGQVVETSLLEAAGALAAHRLIRDESGEPLFNRFVSAFYRPYATADGAFGVACYPVSLHERLLATLGLEALLQDPRFADTAGRRDNADALIEIVAERMAGEPTATWVERFDAAGLSYGVVSEQPLSLLDHPDARAIGLVTEIEDPTLGRETVIGPPIRFSRTPGGTSRPAPRLGEHTQEVLDRLAGGA
jgi:crotonobetainyl-CoA:carnitine CoA-transferase CaiB-like acyl-CoA transferase